MFHLEPDNRYLKHIQFTFTILLPHDHLAYFSTIGHSRISVFPPPIQLAYDKRTVVTFPAEVTANFTAIQRACKRHLRLGLLITKFDDCCHGHRFTTVFT